VIDVVANISTKEVIVHGVSDHESESESSTAEFMDELSLQDSLNEVEGPAVESQTVLTEFKLGRIPCNERSLVSFHLKRARGSKKLNY
jgi:hypothetical protein